MDIPQGYLASIQSEGIKKAKTIHSELHAFIDSIRMEFGDSQVKKGIGSFGFYLGLVKGVSMTRLHQLKAEAKEGNCPRKLFVWLVRKERSNKS